jgi:hypothetical protein
LEAYWRVISELQRRVVWGLGSVGLELGVPVGVVCAGSGSSAEVVVGLAEGLAVLVGVDDGELPGRRLVTLAIGLGPAVDVDVGVGLGVPPPPPPVQRVEARAVLPRLPSKGAVLSTKASASAPVRAMPSTASDFDIGSLRLIESSCLGSPLTSFIPVQHLNTPNDIPAQNGHRLESPNTSTTWL